MLIRPPPYKADTSVSLLDLRPTHQVRDRLHAASMSDIHTAIERDGEIEAYVIGRIHNTNVNDCTTYTKFQCLLLQYCMNVCL